MLFKSKLSNLSVRELPDHTCIPWNPFMSTSITQTHTKNKAEIAPNCCPIFKAYVGLEEMCALLICVFFTQRDCSFSNQMFCPLKKRVKTKKTMCLHQDF